MERVHGTIHDYGIICHVNIRLRYASPIKIRDCCSGEKENLPTFSLLYLYIVYILCPSLYKERVG